ncbi:MAG: HD domain-containing protein [Lachnospiraceae bacterium]|nr:HD domain-containing protein [Lachnospiraceae bacterium]
MTFDEMILILKTRKSVDEINKRREDIAGVIPKVRIMFDYDQKNRYHQYDLWMHSLHTVVGLPRNLPDDFLYLAALLHDIGKPDSRCDGKKANDTDMHYYGHPERSMEIVRDEIIPQLINDGVKLSYEDQRRLIYYVHNHDDRVSLRPKTIRRHTQIASYDEFKKLMYLEVADAKAHVQLPIIQERVDTCTRLAGKEGLEIWESIKNNKTDWAE